MARTSLPSSGDALWNVAFECALLRSKKQCRNSFDDGACKSCNMYVRRYADAPEPSVQMLMLHANTEAYKEKRKRMFHHIKYALIAAVFIYFIIDSRIETQWRKAPTETVYQAVARSHSEIDRTLRLVETDMRRKVDYNNDGKINCIDAAVSFYKHFPDKDRVGIVLNYNPSNGFNHLFISFKFSDGWRSIEPQAYWQDKGTYWMRDYWGRRYDSRFNEVVTDKYSKFVK